MSAEEFLIFNVGDESARMKVGKAYLLLGVTQTAEDARALVEALPATAASKVVIVAKQAVVRRVPTVRLEDIDEPVTDDVPQRRRQEKKQP